MSLYKWVGFVLVGIALVVACGGSSSNNLASSGSATVLCGPTVSCGSLKCDPKLGCVTCLADADCGGTTKVCVFGSCVACKANASHAK